MRAETKVDRVTISLSRKYRRYFKLLKTCLPNIRFTEVFIKSVLYLMKEAGIPEAIATKDAVKIKNAYSVFNDRISSLGDDEDEVDLISALKNETTKN